MGKSCKRCPNGSFVAFDKAPGKYHRDCKSCPFGKADFLDNIFVISGCVSLGGSGSGFLIQDRSDHGVPKERNFRS